MHPPPGASLSLPCPPAPPPEGLCPTNRLCLCPPLLSRLPSIREAPQPTGFPGSPPSCSGSLSHHKAPSVPWPRPTAHVQKQTTCVHSLTGLAWTRAASQLGCGSPPPSHVTRFPLGVLGRLALFPTTEMGAEGGRPAEAHGGPGRTGHRTGLGRAPPASMWPPLPSRDPRGVLPTGVPLHRRSKGARGNGGPRCQDSKGQAAAPRRTATWTGAEVWELMSAGTSWGLTEPWGFGRSGGGAGGAPCDTRASI